MKNLPYHDLTVCSFLKGIAEMVNFYLISRTGDASLTEIVPKVTEWMSLVTWHQVGGEVYFTCLLPLLTAYLIQHQVSGGIGEAMAGMFGESLVLCLWLLGGSSVPSVCIPS